MSKLRRRTRAANIAISRETVGSNTAAGHIEVTQKALAQIPSPPVRGPEKCSFVPMGPAPVHPCGQVHRAQRKLVVSHVRPVSPPSPRVSAIC